MADQLSARLNSYGELAEGIAAQARLVDAVLRDDQAVLDEYRSMLQAVLPGVLRVRFLPPGIDTVDERDSPALGYACLDLAQRGATNNPRPPMEVHVFRTEHQHIDLLRPVKAEQGVVATLLISMDVKLLNPWLKPLVPASAYVELKQDAALTIAAHGQMQLKNQSRMYRVAVQGSSWSLHYWPDVQGGALQEQTMGMVVAFGGALAGVIVVLLGYVMSLKRRVHKDLVTLVKLVVDAAQGRSGKERPRLLEFRNVVAAFERRRQKVDEAVAEEQLHELEEHIEPETEMDDDELSSALFLKDTVEVEELGGGAVEELPEPEPGDEEGPAADSLSADEVARTLKDIEKDG